MMFVIEGGSSGRGGAIHFPLLQQNVALSPSNKTVLHFVHIVFHSRVFHRFLRMERLKDFHQLLGGTIVWN
jgi:hypothetical protein